MAAFNLSDDILRAVLMDCESLKLIWMRFKAWGLLISALSRKTGVSDVPLQPNTAFTLVWALYSYDPHKEVFFTFSITWHKAVGNPKSANKASISQSPAVQPCTYVPLKLKAT